MFEDIKPADLSYVGKKAGRPDMVEKLTGEAMFVSDMELPGMLHAQLKKSPYARARIKHIDTTKAASMPGVRAVVIGGPMQRRRAVRLRGIHVGFRGEQRVNARPVLLLGGVGEFRRERGDAQEKPQRHDGHRGFHPACSLLCVHRVPVVGNASHSTSMIPLLSPNFSSFTPALSNRVRWRLASGTVFS